MLRRTGLAIAAALAFALTAAAPTRHLGYAEGQVWSYRTRAEDPSSLLKINKIEGDARGGASPIYHICVVGVHFGGSAMPKTIAHLPVSRQTLDNSVIALMFSSSVFPDSAAGIARWRAAHGGVFSIPVSEIVEIIDPSAPRELAH